MSRMTAGCLQAMLLLALPPLSPAATITVDPGGGGDFTGIQEALDAAADGDRVLVRPGEYLLSEPLDFNRNSDPSSGDGKNLVLQSENGPAVTTLRMTRMDGSSSDRAILVFHRGETRASALIGFTLTGGGHAIRLWGESNPVIRDCIITHNATDDPAHEGAIQTDFEGYPHLVEDCVIIDNDATGVVFPVDGVPVILLKRCLIARNSPHGVIGANATDCEIADNGGVGISGSALGCRITGNSTGVGIRYEGTISITDSLITRNRAWGVRGFFANAIVTNSVILENGGGGISVIDGGGVHAVNSAIVGNGGHGVEVEVFFPQAALLESCIIWGNAGQSVAQFTPEGGDPSHQAPPTILYCDTAEPEPGVGNISADPLFCENADGNSLALSDGSPCLGTGAGGVDMGASTGTCDGLIVDDGALSTQAVGNWYVSGAPSPYGSKS
ncbi:MAG TPA: right-handed parallel beta-helix repeat-containing protein, partial [Planctomycetota bacterium]|nr:right-handed parallel beta-helix repeat-containing protein [Planctomycetota bacterium]